ncbi:4Fe-4S binding protein [Aliiroseovarius sp. Z3]|uniref:4Fe-4S binding protein n=1 Tax=Aliiroseovarius sp. Z3 TaxID=2811402 RepID=UPI0023B27C08|nr:4Fe-4S binding protein [Aliiroseovarius sp. Z3]MDE9450053.1 4Fe-4S binding protein [Aliiroseovarius sp. Z3]
MIYRLLFGLLLTLCLQTTAAQAGPMERAELEGYIVPPFSLGDPLNDNGVWSLLNSGGAEAGYVFETEPLAPLPGFSGAAINVLVMLDLDGRFMDARLINHNEPIFVSGLGEAPFHRFFEQYAGLSISSSMVVGSPYGGGSGASSLVYLDGVTKATASVRIAHESIMAATLAVAREKMQGLAARSSAAPDPDYDETLTWQDLVDQGIATHHVVSNAEVDAQFAGTLWADDDPDGRADPDGAYLDLWLVDIGPPSIARAALSSDTFDELQAFLRISPEAEPILLIERARHGLVSEDFVRNTSPDLILAQQDGLPIALRDADILVELAADVPDGTALILRTDRRLGFDPTSEWVLQLQAQRSHGMFQPEIGAVTLEVPHATDARFFHRPDEVSITPPWLDAIRNRQGDLIVLGGFLTLLVGGLALAQSPLAGLAAFTPLRLTVLAFVTGFIGWWGQGQLSIVTVLASLRTLVEGASFAYLLYDPFSLLVWGVALVGLILWGRGFFCGWLCPFGALQEFMHHIGQALRLPQVEPSAPWDRRLKRVKYVLLAGLVATVFIAPDHVDTVAEVEPFKTAITVFFVRDWYYVVYAAFWLGLALVTFKGFCRYVCPLGAFMALGGVLRGRDWIPRRVDCGSPCQLCKVRCKYGAIERSGDVTYSECFQCLDCVTIHDDPAQCVPLILARRQAERRQAAE